MSVDTRALHFKVVDFISNGTAEMELEILVFLFCGEVYEILLL